jgi:RimJ/RimL family protein N-acetyltransferase
LGVGRLSIEPDGKNGELAFIIVDQWQGQGLGTKVVDYVLEIAKDMGVETVYAIMLPDNRRALNLTKKMGFKLEYLTDGTVKGVLDLREEVLSAKCPEPSMQIGKKEKLRREDSEKDAEPEAEITQL